MQYCSIEEAWNTNNSIDNFANINQNIINRHDYANYNENNIVEHLENNSENNLNLNKLEDLSGELIEEEEEEESIHKNSILEPKCDKNMTCKELIDKILNCKECLNLLKQRYKSNNILDSLLTDNNREILMIILMGIFLILILDLFVKIGKNISIKK